MYAPRGRTEVGLETIFWPSPARCSRVRGRIWHARGSAEPRPPRCRDGIAGCFTSELGKARSRCGGKSTADRTSWPREGRGGLDRPGRRRGATSHSLPHTVHLCHVWSVQGATSSTGAGRRGPPARIGKSARHPRASRGFGEASPRGPGRPSRSPTPPRVWRRTSGLTASPCGGEHLSRCIHPSPDLLSRRQPGSLAGSSGSPCPGGLGAPGRPSFFFLSAAGPGVGGGCGNAETYRTPRRGKARPAQTSTAETLLCSSDGP